MRRNILLEMETDQFHWLFVPALLTGLLTGIIAMLVTALVRTLLDARAIRRGKPPPKRHPQTGERPPYVSEMLAFTAIIAVPVSGAILLPRGYAGNSLSGVLMGIMIATIIPLVAGVVRRWKSRPRRPS